MPESEQTEFKKSLAELKEGLISMVAILNKHGAGELWFGIKNDGAPIGLEISEKTLRDVSQSIASHIEPKLYPAIKEEAVSGKSCLKIAFNGTGYPYYAYGRAYMRVSDADRQLSANELERLILKKNRSHQSWDTEASTFNLRALNQEGIRAFVEKADLEWNSVEAALENLSLLREGQLRNAALVFFKANAPYELRTAVFASTTNATLLDQQSYRGGLLELVEKALSYILKNIHIGMRIEGLERIEVPEIEPEALREAVIHAFCHRDYRDPHPVEIAIYRDRVEIRNPGMLIEGMTLEDLLNRTVSRRRNPLIADLLRRVKMVESWGRGIPLILEKAPQTEFSQKAGLFISTLHRIVETSGKTSRKTSGKTSGKIVAIMRDNAQITIPELAEEIGVTERTIERNIQKLRQAKTIRRAEGARSGHWEILKPDKKH